MTKKDTDVIIDIIKIILIAIIGYIIIKIILSAI